VEGPHPFSSPSNSLREFKMTMPPKIPQRLAESCRQVPERAAWLSNLPGLVSDLKRRWSLAVHDPFEGEGSCAWVAPVQLVDGASAVLKLSMPHMEGKDEIAGLRFWNGIPTVRLLEADDGLGAMLIERCEPGTTLRKLSEPEQDVTIAYLLNQLWRVPPPGCPFRSLSVLIKYWSEETLASADRWFDPGLVRAGLNLFTELLRTAPREALLATDMHAGNVLQARREPWLVIDPKPFVGDPSYDATQHLLNCQGRLRSDADGVVRRFADLLQLDHQRVRLWTFARAAADPRGNWKDHSLTEVARSLAA
jgi:streptomycin 6-kinase